MFRASLLAIALSVTAIASATIQAAAFPSRVLGGGQIGAELDNKYGMPEAHHVAPFTPAPDSRPWDGPCIRCRSTRGKNSNNGS